MTTTEAPQVQPSILDLPPLIGEAFDVLEQAESALPTPIEASRGEAALNLSRAFFGEPDAVMGAAQEVTDNITQAERLVKRVGHVVTRLVDESLVLANEAIITRHYKAVQQGAATRRGWGNGNGNGYAQRLLTKQYMQGDATGGYLPTGALSDGGSTNFSVYIAGHDHHLLEQAKKEPLDIDVEEAEVILAAPITELKRAIEQRDTPTIVELSGAVRLVIGHVDLDELIHPSANVPSQMTAASIQ
jgi:hypothetical protein